MKVKNNRIRLVHVRLTTGEYNGIHKKFKRTTCRTFSEYIRAVLLERPVITTYRNLSQDALLEQMAILNRELNAIGNNINQVAKKLHTLRHGEIALWQGEYDTQSTVFTQKTTEIKSILKTLTEEWLR
ncbi:plasmid mobilization protein [Flavobacterium beibuense]|uniref:Mobilization protein n=1 Tax=Flavobacterium beibuense TaxID=657326 RepID=A0A444WES9_9FLAO|nr:plasmid mobilization relaxosome protein MobC [Flavobacterium beibuense]RYJ44276.1 mobilization protein [Flavobacterium beibuense]